MKRFLSVVLAFTMLFTTVAFAAPTPVATVEEAQETTQEVLGTEEDAVLMGATAMPGINVYTGTTSPASAEDFSVASLTSRVTVSTGNASITVVPNPDDATDMVYLWTLPYLSTPVETGEVYPTIRYSFDDTLEKLVGHNKVYFSFDLKKVAAEGEEGSYTNAGSFWIMNSSGSGNDIAYAVGASSSWKSFNSMCDMLKYSQSSTPTVSTTVTSLLLETNKYKSDTVKTHMYMDNLMAVPAYEFTYYTADGSTLLKTVYEAVDEDGNIITSYTPIGIMNGDDYIYGWTDEIGTAAKTTFALENENKAFYASETKPVIEVAKEGIANKAGDMVTLTPSVISECKETVSITGGSWTIEDESVATIETQSNGSAVVTAVAEGKTNAIFTTTSGVSATYEISNVFPYVISAEDALSGTEQSINANDYVALVVQLSDTVDGAEYPFSYSVDGGEAVEMTITAVGTETRDYYFNTADLEGWTDSESFAVTFDSAAQNVLQSVSLYSEFDSGYRVVFNGESTYLNAVAQELVFSYEFITSLVGVYDESVTWNVENDDDVVSYAVMDDGSLLLRAKPGTGYVNVTMTSNEDESIVFEKEIYVDVEDAVFADALGGTLTDYTWGSVYENGKGSGNTTLTIENNMFHLDRPESTGGTTGIVLNDSVEGAYKYLVLKVSDDTSLEKVYYSYNGLTHSETNTARTFSTSDEDGDYKYLYAKLANVPDDAEKTGPFMVSIPGKSEGDIVYMYTTNEEPEIKAADTIAYTWDFATKTFNGTGHHKHSVFNGETAALFRTLAVVGTSSSASSVIVDTTTTEIDGEDYYAFTVSNNGSANPISYPSGITLSDYPYIWLKYKLQSNASVSLYLMDQDKGGSEAGWDAKAISLPASDEFVWKIIDLNTTGHSAALNTTFTSMMFSYTSGNVIDASTIKTVTNSDGTTSYYAKAPLTYSSTNVLEIDEMTIANYDPFAEDEQEEEEPLEIAVVLTADKTEITEDGGSVTITPHVYSNKEITNKAVTYTVDNGNVQIVENEDGTLTLNAIYDGDVTITATSVEDSTCSGTITISITGQREKIAAFDFKYYAIGNSYLNHGGTDQFSIWCGPSETSRGMAASEPDLDYYHRIQHYLTTGLNGTITATRVNCASLENVSETCTSIEDAQAAIESEFNYNTIKNYLIDEKPNVITVQLSENFSGSGDIETNFYDQVYGMIDEYRPEKSVVVVITPFSGSTRVSKIKTYAAKYGFYVADMSDIGSYSKVPSTSSADYNSYVEVDGVKYYRGNTGYKYNPYLAWHQYPQYDDWLSSGKATTDFRSHPGDLGMEEIAKRAFALFEDAVPAYLDAEYIYVPASIAITGADAITEEDGSIQLDIEVTPADSATDVIWSTDSDLYATIDADGVLTAKNNGTVVVTAKSAYNNEITATKTITISGQPDVFTVTYHAGTDDEVENLPAADEYAKGEYTVSTVVPSRNGYKFVGWATEEGGSDVGDTINVTFDTELYALWAFAESWHFDVDGDAEGITLGGFNVTVQDGYGTVLPYNDLAVSISDSTLLLDSTQFDGFNISVDLFGSEQAENELTLTITTKNNTYTYTQEVTAAGGVQTVYSFDISDVTGVITGFAITPSATDCTAKIDWIEFERTALYNDVTVDEVNVVNDITVDLGGKTYTIGTLNIADGVTATFVNGALVTENNGWDGNIVTKGANVVTSDSTVADLFVKLSNPDGYDSIEIDGYQYDLVEEYKAEYNLMIPDEPVLVQLVKGINSVYYVVDGTTVTAVEGLADYMYNSDSISMRVEDPLGIRFKSFVYNSSKEETESFEIAEYGWVIALERDLLNAGEQLTLDFAKKAVGVAYNAAEDLDVIFEQGETTTAFTGVLHGIPSGSYGVKLVAKTYTKINVGGVDYVIYGDEMKASAYEIAKMYENSTELDEATMAEINKIIDESENGDDLGFDFGDL